MRLMRVIADPMTHSTRLLAVEVAVRTALIAFVAALLFWILPVIADAAA